MPNGKKKNSALVKTDETSIMNRPSFIAEHDTRGAEHIGKDDIQMPRLGLAQAQSPQMLEGDPKYIDGLRVGELFNNLTDANYSKGPVVFSLVRADPPRGIEFTPLEDGGGIKDFDVPLDDPRMQWDGDNKPIATKFYDFVLMLWPTRELIALSLKSSGLKVARQLNTYIKLRSAPVFAGKYELTTTMAKGPAGQYATYVIKNAGWADEEEYQLTSQAYESLKDKTIDIERVPGDEVEDLPI
jgi:hypothetical protein